MTEPKAASDLAELLEDFSERVNGHARLRLTMSGWQPDFYIQARDSGETFQVQIADQQVQRVVRVTAEPDDAALLLRGDDAILRRVFSGDLSPLRAYTDGLLEVYGSQKDQIKLDAIALVVWGA